MQFKKGQVLLIMSLILILGIVSGTAIYLHGKLQAIEEDFRLQEEHLLNKLEQERMQGYIEFAAVEDTESGYLVWEKANEIATHMYEDSGQKFEKDWALFLSLEAERKGIDPFLVYELIRVETGGTFDPKTVGPETKYGQAYGLAQFMKNTGPWVAEMAGVKYDHKMLFDPYYSIQLSIVYLDFLYQQYGDWNHALTAYHRGIYGLEKYIEENGHAESWYAVEIQENAEDGAIGVYDE